MSAEPSPRTYAVPLAALLAAQDGVVSRAQLVDAGCEPHDLERMIRRKELFVALPRHRDERATQRPSGVGPGLRPALSYGGPGGAAARCRWLGGLADFELAPQARP